MPKRILFLTPYPKDTAGSQRFRFEQYLPLLFDAGFEYKCQSFIDKQTWSILYKKGYSLQKLLGILTGFLRRFWMLTTLNQYDYVFIHREATPLGPPIIEWLMAKIWGKEVIYDFDDAIWLKNTSRENNIMSWLKFSSKVNDIVSWSHKISAGNEHLMDHSVAFNQSVFYNPTTIDTTQHLPMQMENQSVIIGWTGTHSTLKYLEVLRKPLEQLSNKHEFKFLVIADRPPLLPLPNQKFISWSKETEIVDLNSIDIGVMPLENDQWAQGKCGFKALQFMALEKPVLVSPVGVNTQIVENGIHGYHCELDIDWETHLEELVIDKKKRRSFGIEGRKKVIDEFSVESNKENFLILFS